MNLASPPRQLAAAERAREVIVLPAPAQQANFTAQRGTEIQAIVTKQSPESQSQSQNERERERPTR